MTTEEIRESFLQFFASKGHTIVPSSSLIPADDPTLLFVNAGMVQFKDCFLGSDKRPYTRATTCQKSLRISGKHNDLENVGRTARHHTFFEMLGNFSFGDYFKKEAILYAWEYLTEVLKLPKERLWVTIYEEDDEAGELWKSLTDVYPGRVLRCGKEDNFWAMGETGPCGPCSEIHYYLGNNVAGQSEEEFRKGDGTYIEIWNLVFMQFNRDTSGNLTPLPKPSVDTGMGLERVAAVKQGVLANYDTDLLRNIISATEKLSGKSYDGRDYRARDPESDPQYGIDVAHRVIADHVRACAFLIADGVNPSSDGRGYVLRRLLRRACRHGRVLGFREPFLHKIAAATVDLMARAYPELREFSSKIDRLIKAEEEKFLETLETGLVVLEKELSETAARKGRNFSGKVAFMLHDTYGFPLDLTEDLIRSKGLVVDRSEFDRSMDQQRERSRSARSQQTELLLQRSVKPLPTKFVGYEFLEYESVAKGLFDQSGEVKVAKKGDELAVITEETPFYGESGGQVGDTGVISSNSAALEVIDTQKVGGGSIVHICRVTEGELGVGERVRLSVAEERRNLLKVHHSATHLLHLALRTILGTHVQQAGSKVSDSFLRFDFNHFEPLSPAVIEEIEQFVAAEIRANGVVQTSLLPIEEAKKSGAMALFGEKYGDIVRVVQIGPRSRELCGGTHVSRSGDIGAFCIESEGAISAGVRRIEAFAGSVADRSSQRRRALLAAISSTLKTGEGELEERVLKLLERSKELEKQLSRSQQSEKARKGGDLSEEAFVAKDGTKVVATLLDNVGPKELREMADELKSRLRSGCIALGSVVDGKPIVLTAVTNDLTARYNANTLLQKISAVVGGKGGGRADLAQAGGGDPSKLKVALEQFQEQFS